MMSFFPRNFSKASNFTVTSRHCLCFAPQYRTELARSTSFSSFSQLSAPFLLLFLGFSLPEGSAGSPAKGTWEPQGVESFLSISLTGDLRLGKQLLVGGDGGQVLALSG